MEKSNVAPLPDRNSQTRGCPSLERTGGSLTHLLLSACAFGFAMAWLQFSYNASNLQFAFAPDMPWIFRQAARVPTVVILLIYPYFSQRAHSAAVAFPVCALAALGSVSLTAVTSIAQHQSVPLAFACGLLCGIAFTMPVAKWITSSLGSSFTALFSTVSLGAVITGALSLTLSLLNSWLAASISLALPLCSMAFLARLEKTNASPSLLSDAACQHRSLLYFVSMTLVGGLAWTVFVDNWMPDISLSFLWFFMPCGLVSCAVILAVAKMRIASEMLFSLLVGTASIISLLALSPVFSNAVFYSAIFTSAWFLLLFAIAASVWYGSAYGDSSLRAACFSIALIYLTQMIARFVTSLFPRHDVVLLVAAVVLLALSLALLIVAQMRGTAANAAKANGSAKEKSEGRCFSALVREYGLTDREVDVLRLLAKGNTVKSVAEKLVVSENTVKFHRGNIYQKLCVNSRQDLIDMIDELPDRS